MRRVNRIRLLKTLGSVKIAIISERKLAKKRMFWKIVKRILQTTKRKTQ